jgi:hypothetical protein
LKTPNELAKVGVYITSPSQNAEQKRWQSITSYIKYFNFNIGAELGVSIGQNFDCLMQLNKNLRLYGIDSFESEGNELEQYDKGLYQGRTQTNAIENAKRIEEKYPNRARMIFERTDKACEIIPDGHLDFIFIDADHTYEGVIRDIEMWEPKVQKDGLIIGHDLNWGSVARAVGEKFSSFWISADNVWASPKYWYNDIRT